MGKNCADRRCSSEWDSFIATQAYSALCKSKTMKEVKSGERQKRWQMRRMILGDINMPLNHITEGLSYKRTYTSLACNALFSSSSVSSSLIQPYVVSLCCFLFSSPALCLLLPPSRFLAHTVLSWGFDTPRLLCAKDDSHLRSLCWALMQTTVPPCCCCQTYQH